MIDCTPGRALAACLLFAVGFAAPAFAVDAGTKPNIILINCDDLGYNDTGPYGSTKHRTPHLDRMAAEGIRFTDFYAASGVCSPSRAALMTGCYPRRVGLHVNAEGRQVLFPVDAAGLHDNEITMAHLLKSAGYVAAIVGKWHLGDQPEFLPTRRGFDSYFGIPYSNDMGAIHKPHLEYPRLPVLEGETVVETEPDQRYLTRRYTHKVIAQIEANRDRPFFIYMPHTMPHWPMYASEDFAGKSANGDWGDAVEEIDWSVGQILAALKKLKLDERTLVLFTSDNGGALPHGSNNDPLRGGKNSTWEGGHRVPLIARWPGRIPAGTVQREMATQMDLYPTLGALAGAAIPRDRIIDGRDIRPLLFNEAGARTPHEAFYYYRGGELQAVRSGVWKLFVNTPVAPRAKGPPSGPVLFNLETDIGESTNVLSEHPQVVRRLEKLLERAREDLGDGEREGANTRPAGRVDNPRPLTTR